MVCVSGNIDQTMIIGIDYGAKTAGTTVIARLYEYDKVDFHSSKVGQDADQFISDFLDKNEDIWLSYIDAPLSLPKIYRNGLGEGDYFYRKADRSTGAMSPMFLGGLTARAMKLKASFKFRGIKLVETYPSKLAEVLGLKEKGYKTKLGLIPKLCEEIKSQSMLQFNNEDVKNWHHFDALLCLYSAKRFEIQAAMVFGDEEEGTITV